MRPFISRNTVKITSACMYVLFSLLKLCDMPYSIMSFSFLFLPLFHVQILQCCFFCRYEHQSRFPPVLELTKRYAHGWRLFMPRFIVRHAVPATWNCCVYFSLQAERVLLTYVVEPNRRGPLSQLATVRKDARQE